jgi:hypothetical protein
MIFRFLKTPNYSFFRKKKVSNSVSTLNGINAHQL